MAREIRSNRSWTSDFPFPILFTCQRRRMQIEHRSPPKPFRSKLRRRSILHFLHLKTGQCFLFLTAFFVGTVVTFLITFYLNSDYLSDFISYVLFPRSRKAPDQRSPDEIVKNYQPRMFSGKVQSTNYDQSIKYEDFDYLKNETLTYQQRTYSKNAQLLFRLPVKRTISAVLLVFHACRRSAKDWFHTVERQRILGAAIDLGYGCLVFQALDSVDRCWSHTADIYDNEDVQKIFRELDRFYEDHPQLVTLPRFTFGESSGGIFSSIFVLNHRYPIKGQILFASIILPEILFTYVKVKNYPPTTWIHMLRDMEFASEDRINMSIRIFAEQSIPYRTCPIEPISLTPTLFHERIPAVTWETSRFLFYRLQQNDWLNVHNYLIYNPRRKRTWQEFLFSANSEQFRDAQTLQNLNEHQLAIVDFLNTIYGEHEISYERSYEAFKWLLELYHLPGNQSEATR